MKFLLFLCFIFCATAHGTEPASLNCEPGNHTIKIKASVARGLMRSGDIFHGIGIVNTTNRQLLPACNFTQEGDYFVYRTDSDTLKNCPVQVTLTEGNITEVYTVQLFRSPPADALVDRAMYHQWVFTCNTRRELSVLSGVSISTHSRSFKFNRNSSIEYVYSISFYNDSSYQQVLNRNRVAYRNRNQVFMRVSVVAPENIVLLLTSCRSRNLASNATTTLISSNRCPAEGVKLSYYNRREINVEFNASFDTPNDLNVENEFFEITCVTELCDMLIESCSSAKCSQSCDLNNKGVPVCSCRKGFALQEDKRNCKEKDQAPKRSPNNAIIKKLAPVPPQSPPRHSFFLFSTTIATPVSTSSRAFETSTTTSTPKTLPNFKKSLPGQNKKLPISFKSQDEIFESRSKNKSGSKDVSEIAGSLQPAMFYASIALTAILIIVIMAMIHQIANRKKKSINTLDILTRSGGKQLR